MQIKQTCLTSDRQWPGVRCEGSVSFPVQLTFLAPQMVGFVPGAGLPVRLSAFHYAQQALESLPNQTLLIHTLMGLHR